MAQRLPYNGQIPIEKEFYGKQYELLGYTTSLAALNEGIKEFKKVYPNKYEYHITTQKVTPKGSGKPIKIHVSYVRKI
jgi:hypothetical protein